MWSTPPADLRLHPHRADVWRVFTNLEPDSVKSFESSLSADESQRASQFHFDRDRFRFIVAHASLRDVLGRYLRREPRQLEFSANEFGKPQFLNRDIEFNLSHSGDFALIAVARGRNVGVDVELIREAVELENLATRYFSPREVSELMVLPVEQRTIGFFNCWTRKEAYVKARGRGLSLPLDGFDVSLTPNEPAVLRVTRPDAREASHWSLRSLDVDPDYAGALAVEGRSLELRYWDWNAADR